MRSLNRLGTRPASLPLAADDIVEFHAARLLLLTLLCGVSGRIEGLTKMAKLDFFSRYPEFFEAAAQTQAKPVPSHEPSAAVESAMVRHHYGPWDKRYYHVLAHLEAKQLIKITKVKKTYVIALTEIGKERAQRIAEKPSFQPLAARMREIKKVFGLRTGSSLKNMIYNMFDSEVSRRPLGEIIEK
ncbi:conserved hypothetical protein [Bosea sp. 62]|uniref:hypothetical protein n=1 Tax=unclassified Bosea (in: a-proteobacteria) TaxID=2653178 RepID=UPI00125BB6D9|nr:MULTISPECIES: hypothetical protein [unclassified Bosea (in: a-proteobacteria)]CAD5261007.1 conserved hypothetical protein [Bosea sp. 7B]CAD5271553.1 conserved hypothetical protein [Bosea sp. 21B]CAD5273734.1 conserved hypothetical protein [Bosea sp. 46]VVT56193.1 conserved hypothetical protein [Bosea sp. EC-HK365B]VXB63518.1 conserved hypothetical protein [Bosea sp. 62]